MSSTVWVVVLLSAYVIGSLPCGWLIARLVIHDDIRNHGSGNIGATNVYRVIGPRWGLVTLLFDACKGVIPVLLLPQAADRFTGQTSPHAAVFCGLLAIAGHMYPVWLGFRGGKGVATALGAVTVMAWQATLVALIVFVAVFMFTRLVALASMLAAVGFAVAELVLLGKSAFESDLWSLATFALVVPLLIVLRHRSNLVRILRGQEERFSFQRAESGNTVT